MEEVYGLYGVEGNGTFKVFDEEVEMTLPFAKSDTFEIVNSTPIFPAELKDNPDAFFVRGKITRADFVKSRGRPIL